MRRKVVMMLAATLLVAGTMAACSTESTTETKTTKSTSTKESTSSTENTTDATPEHGVIKILYKGDKTDGWDDVYAEFLERTKDTLNTELDITWVPHADYKQKLNLEITSGADYDLVFEASWLQLATLSQEGYYADLSEYFNNPEYPGLQASFPEEVMEANKWYGNMCYIPVYQSFGNGAGCVWYRQDWADDWGIGQIDSYDKLEAYWAKAKSEGILPYTCSSSRGYFQLMTIGGGAYEGSAKAGIQSFSIGGMYIFTYTKDGKLVAMAAEGSGDEAFKDFPEGWNYDFTNSRYEKFNEWQKLGYNSPDSMTVTDYTPVFDAGNAASYTGTVETYATELARFHAITPDGELGFFVYSDAMRNMEEGAIPTNYTYNNGYAIPASSKNIERTMKFFDWMNQSAENHDLIAYGIEGIDWEPIGEYQYEAKSNYAALFPQYSLTLSPKYARFSSNMPEEALQYALFSMTPEATTGLPIRGYQFDKSDTEIANAVALVQGITTSFAAQSHGILSDGTTTYASATEMRKARYDQCMEAGLQLIMDALKAQIEEHLANN